MSAIATKAEPVTRMLDELQAELGGNTFDIVDHWESDRYAIGIARPDNHGVLVYVSTYGHRKDVYWVSLELPPRVGDELPYVPAGEMEVRGIQELAFVVRTHFEEAARTMLKSAE